MTVLFFPSVLRHLDRSPEFVEGRSGEIPVLRQPQGALDLPD